MLIKINQMLKIKIENNLISTMTFNELCNLNTIVLFLVKSLIIKSCRYYFSAEIYQILDNVFRNDIDSQIDSNYIPSLYISCQLMFDFLDYSLDVKWFKNASILQLLISIQMKYSIDSHIDPQFECSCGKSYLSYSSLLTHKKNKHSAAAVKISQPVAIKKRGRPVTNCKQLIKRVKQVKASQDINKINTSLSLCQSMTKMNDQDCITKIDNILKESNTLPLNKIRLNQMGAFIEMNVFLLTKKNSPVNLYLGDVVAQFLQIMSKKSAWRQFQQIYVLLVVFIEYIIEELNEAIIATGPIDLLCDFINDFLQIGADRVIRQYEISEYPVFKPERMLNLFQVFFRWLMVKGYTKYKITINDNFKRMETQDNI